MSRVRLTNPIWLEWFGGFVLLAPPLHILAVKRRELPLTFGALLLVAFLLTIWQARWGPFLAVILCLTIPTLLATLRTKWLGLLLAALPFTPFLAFSDRALWPNEESPARRALAQREAAEWRGGGYFARWRVRPFPRALVARSLARLLVGPTVGLGQFPRKPSRHYRQREMVPQHHA